MCGHREFTALLWRNLLDEMGKPWKSPELKKAKNSPLAMNELATVKPLPFHPPSSEATCRFLLSRALVAFCKA